MRLVASLLLAPSLLAGIEAPARSSGDGALAARHNHAAD
jgi:hypothetical protein